MPLRLLTRGGDTVFHGRPSKAFIRVEHCRKNSARPRVAEMTRAVATVRGQSTAFGRGRRLSRNGHPHCPHLELGSLCRSGPFLCFPGAPMWAYLSYGEVEVAGGTVARDVDTRRLIGQLGPAEAPLGDSRTPSWSTSWHYNIAKHEDARAPSVILCIAGTRETR
nr:hypothetical protein CFP56_33507 [Quercus suber]